LHAGLALILVWLGFKMRLRRGVGNRRFLLLLPARCESADSPRNGAPTVFDVIILSCDEHAFGCR
jgi:hypothetical protein